MTSETTGHFSLPSEGRQKENDEERKRARQARTLFSPTCKREGNSEA